MRNRWAIILAAKTCLPSNFNSARMHLKLIVVILTPTLNTHECKDLAPIFSDFCLERREFSDFCLTATAWKNLKVRIDKVRVNEGRVYTIKSATSFWVDFLVVVTRLLPRSGHGVRPRSPRGQPTHHGLDQRS